MPGLTLRLLGGFHAQMAERPPLVLPTKKTQALLAYLAVPPGREHPRERLMTLLWGDAVERQARHSLRQALFSLRRTLVAAGREILVEREVIALNPDAAEVDVTTLERLVAEGTPEALGRVLDLYRGDLLDGLNVPEPAFEEWLIAERERLRETARGALVKLLAHQSEAGLVDAGVRTAARLLALDPYQESVHRTLMRLYTRQGRRGAALQHYQACVAMLRRELGVEPDLETRRLYQELLQREAPPPTGPAVATSTGRPRKPAARPRPEGPAPEGPLIGRESEVERLYEALERAWRGDGHVLLVVGEAGVGKSRLVGELIAEALRQDGRALVGVSHQTEKTLPFRPWVDALRSGQALGTAEALDGLSPGWRAELARLFPELGGPYPQLPTTVEDSVRLFDAVTELVGRLAARQPLLLVLEDLHWADEMSLRLAAFLGRRLGDRPVLLVGTAREEELADAPLLHPLLQDLDRDRRLTQVALPSLSRDQTTRLVRALTRGPQTDAIERVAEQVWAISEGNPFVIVELIRALDERRAGPEGSLPLPRRVRELVDARLGRLGERARALAAVPAAVGGVASFPLLERVSALGAGAAAEAVEELVRRRVLDAVDEGFDFTHDRIRAVVYDGLPVERRRALHAAIGESLEILHAGRLDEVHDRLALHYARADDADKAATYLSHFADRAARRYALDEAARALQDAEAFAERLPGADGTRRLLDRRAPPRDLPVPARPGPRTARRAPGSAAARRAPRRPGAPRAVPLLARLCPRDRRRRRAGHPVPSARDRGGRPLRRRGDDGQGPRRPRP